MGTCLMYKYALVLLVAHGYTTDARIRECKLSDVGFEYRGLVNVTRSGRTCQRWDTTSPHSHVFTQPHYFPDFSMAEVGNHCRNPDDENEGPWCYTTDPGSRYEFCDVPQCSNFPECKVTELGKEYRGHVSETRTTVPCIDWPVEYETEANFCRNPDDKPEGPWCWTSPTEWDYCAVTFCKVSATCKKDVLGTNFVGRVTETISGRQCQRWDKQAPHVHDMTDDDQFPDATVEDAANYCRNPDDDAAGPWCYTTDPDIRREGCAIPVCQDCKSSGAGRDYGGTVAQTRTGLDCQRWDSQLPHPHNLTDPDRFPDANLVDASNYCRNPDGKADGPWCFTDDPDITWESCEIPECNSCEDDVPLKRRVNHVVHIGIDGLRPDCIADAPGGAPNLLQRLRSQGTSTLTKARTVILTFSAPAWSATLCGMHVDRTGINSNGWYPPWLGGIEPITPATGNDISLPCVFQHLKGIDSTIHTASFYDWSWLRNMANRGMPSSVDREDYCRGHPVRECDYLLVNNATEYLGQVFESAERSYTFIYNDDIDTVGHSLGWCSSDYADAVALLDERVGQILDVIDNSGHAGDTLVVLSSDHGGEGFSHGAEQDSDLFIPMFVRGPTVKEGHEFTSDVGNMDIVPTVMFALGHKPNPFWSGKVMYEAFEDL